MDRRILHIDMDAFFASVEQVLNPALRGKPLIVGGSKEDTRGVVATASYEARRYGVHSAMPLAQAKKLCPDGIFVRGNFERYQEASDKVRDVLETVSPIIEFTSIDEAYVDVTGSQRLFGGDDAIAQHIKSEIRHKTGLPCTIAITPNKLVSKVASAEGKPDGYVCVRAGEERDFLRDLGIGKLPGVGPRMEESLMALGITTIGDLAAMPIGVLLARFGPMAYALQRRAQGLSTAEVTPATIPKSMGRETTFERDLTDWARIEQILAYLMERVAFALREHRMEARCVTLKVRYADFSTHTFAKTLNQPTALDYEIAAALRELVPKARVRPAPVRLIGVTLSALNFDQHQLHLFGKVEADKWERALESVDALRERLGFEYLRCGKSMGLGRDVHLATPSLSR